MNPSRIADYLDHLTALPGLLSELPAVRRTLD
jgi:hypothetical protein